MSRELSLKKNYTADLDGLTILYYYTLLAGNKTKETDRAIMGTRFLIAF